MLAQHPYFRILSEKFAGHGRKFAKKASQTYVVGGIAGFEIGVGTIRPATAADKVLGFFDKAIGSTDTGYADTSPIDVEICFRSAEVFCPVSSGTIGITELGDELDVVTGGLSLTTTESNNDFRSVALVGASTNSVIATCQTTVY